MKTDDPSYELLYLSGESAAREFIEKWCKAPLLFHEYINEIMVEKNLSLPDLMKSSGINRNYGYNIINGKRLRPSRDKVLALCVAASLSVEQTQEALSIAGVAQLYYKRERDVRIAAALNEGIEDVLSLNILLEKNGMEPLDV